MLYRLNFAGPMKEREAYLELSELHRRMALVYDRLAGEEGKKIKTKRIKDLRKQIYSLLMDHDDGLTSTEVADQLYTTDFGISKHHFLRKVNVMASKMHIMDKGVTKIEKIMGDKYATGWKVIRSAVPLPIKKEIWLEKSETEKAHVNEP